MTYAITGASGQLGKAAAQHLATLVDPTEIVLLTRSPQKLADLTALGVQTREADFNSPETLTQALAGVKSLLLVSTDALGQRLKQHQNAIDAAKEAGVQHLVYTSFTGATPENPSLVTPEQYETEELIKSAGIPFTLLRNGLYFENDVPALQAAVVSGQFFVNTQEATKRPVARQDAAEVAAQVLANSQPSDSTYELTGPDSVSARDLAQIASEITGSQIETVLATDEQYADGLIASGLTADYANVYVSIGKSVREGFGGEESSDIQAILGRPATNAKQALTAALTN